MVELKSKTLRVWPKRSTKTQPLQKPGARIFVRSTSFPCGRRAGATPARLAETWLQQKLLRRKRNESWAMRRFENIRGLTSPTLGVGGNLLCKIVQSGFFVLGTARILPTAAGMLPAGCWFRDATIQCRHWASDATRSMECTEAVRQNAHRAPHSWGRARHPIALATLFALRATICHAQEATPTPSPVEAEVESVVVSATRFEIPLDQSPATVSVIIFGRYRAKTNPACEQRAREVPGLSVVQTGTAGQLTSVFMRGLPSEGHAGAARRHSD